MSAATTTGGEAKARSPDMDTPKPTSEPLTDNEASKDYTIQVEGRSFPVHKDAMVALSDYFQTMLIGSTQMSESQNNVVVIEGVSASVMEVLLGFVYKKSLDVTTENVSEVLAGAMYLQMKPAINVCTEFMARNLDTENWYDVFLLFKMYNLVAAIELIKPYIKQNMQEVLNTLDFNQVQYDRFSFIVNMWKSSETELFEMIQQWVGVDYDKRKEYLDDFLSHVRYGLMMRKELKALKETKEIRHSPKACQLIKNAFDYQRFPMHRKVLETSEQTRVRSDLTFVNCAEARASYLRNTDGTVRVIRTNALRYPARICPYRQVEVNNFIVVASISLRRAVWHMLDPRTSEWTIMAKLPRRFLETVLVSDGRYIYALGGYERDKHSEVMRNIDRYDFRNDTWSNYNMLPVKMVAFGACTLGNALYISGGQSTINRNKQEPPPFSGMDRLDLATGKWESKPPLLKPRSKHTMSVMWILGEEVCCIVDGELSVEYYSPHREQWSRCTFTFSQPLPVRNTGKMLVKGNSLFLHDICTSEEDQDSEYICMHLNIPENGTEVTVEFIYKYNYKLSYGNWFGLSLPPDNGQGLETGDTSDSEERSDSEEICGTRERFNTRAASGAEHTHDKKERRRRRRRNGKYF